MTDTLEHRRSRALYRAQHRGTKEMDWLLGRYADAQLAGMDMATLDHFERFVALPDPDLQRWIMEGAEVDAAPEFLELVTRLRTYHGLTA